MLHLCFIIECCLMPLVCSRDIVSCLEKVSHFAQIRLHGKHTRFGYAGMHLTSVQIIRVRCGHLIYLFYNIL